MAPDEPATRDAVAVRLALVAEYALYVWGNYLREAELDRLPEWLEPAVLAGERVFVHPHVAMSDDGPLRVDASRSLFVVGDEFVSGRNLSPAVTDDWRVSYLRLVTDGSADDAERVIEELLDEIEEQGASSTATMIRNATRCQSVRS
ncbi:hypothetical protein C5N14_12830 [Micromonospora sp. MW-13]|uniref:hypothetical protein n=1 Tax=Micromonospora sp. MW-13 TaxID=2094022 RepID=UPI000ECC6E70|nr:hypothetical protein [Micromonospora sp. MW-13]RGC68578.1 hypothetical protein C5N14_12830 [Micromonospora sp. MW-13]